MNPEFPPNNPRVELEAKLTAFILGELPVHEAAALRQAMEDDTELAALYEQLKIAHKLVREATVSPVEQTQATPTSLKLSEERRQKLLAQFKTVAPKEFAREKQKPRAGTRILEIAAVMAIVAVLAGLLLPSLAKSKSKATSVAIRYRLKAIDSAKQMWAQDNHKSDGDIPTASDIAPYMGRSDGRLQSSIAGETYQIGKVGESSSAELPEKSDVRQRRISLGNDTLALVNQPNTAKLAPSGKKHTNFPNTNFIASGWMSAPPAAGTTIVLPSSESPANTSPTVTVVPSFGVNFSNSGYYDTDGVWNLGIANGGNANTPTDAGIVYAKSSDISAALTALGANPGTQTETVSATNSVVRVGDPDWIGNLEHPDRRHSDSNMFFSRFGFYNDLNANGAVDVPTVQKQPGLVDPATGLPVAPPQVEVRAKFADVTEAADRTLGFNWESRNAAVPQAIEPPASGKEGLLNPEVTTDGGRLAVAPMLGDIPATNEDLLRAGIGRNHVIITENSGRIGANGRDELRLVEAEDKAKIGTVFKQAYVDLKENDRHSADNAQQKTLGNSTSFGRVSTNVVSAYDTSLLETDEGMKRQPDKVTLDHLNREIKDQEDKVDTLQKEFNVVDTDPQSTTPGISLGPVNVQHYNSLQIDAEKQYKKQEQVLKEAKGMDKEQLKQALPKVAPDAILSQLLQDQAESKETLAKLKKDAGPSDPEVQRLEKLVGEYDRETDGRVQAIVKGMEITAKALKAQIDNSGEKLNEARTNDAALAEQTRPYYQARAELERLVQERAALAKMEPAGQKSDITIRSDLLAPIDLPARKKENKAYFDKKKELDELIAQQQAMSLKAAQGSVGDKRPLPLNVEVIEHADAKPEQSPTLGERISGAFTGNVTRTARIKVERDVTDVPGVAGQPTVTGIYDPYFAQTEFEVIQSEKILDKVIERLNLNEAWAAKKGSGTPLKMSETRQLLKNTLKLGLRPNTSLIDIKVSEDKPEEAAKIANTIAEVYRDYRKEQREELIQGGMKALTGELAEQQKKIAQVKKELAQLESESTVQQADAPAPKPAAPAPIPQPEVTTADNAFSTFSLNIADVSFKLAAASLEKGQMPEPASIRSEEFINAFDYRDPEPTAGAPLGFAWERAQYPFAHNRDLLRFSVKTAAAGREAGRPMNIVLLLDKSGSMERADRVRIIHEALRVLAGQLQPQDRLSVVTFARVARLWVDGLPGSQANEVVDGLDKLTPEGGTNLEEAMRLAYETARRHYLAGGINRVVLLTDGAANLGNLQPESLKQSVEAHRQEGIALDCFGVGWEGYNDDLLEVLSRHGDGRYGFINTPEEAASGFAKQLAGALHVAASDVKVQVEFNPKRVTAYRQIGYAKHQLTKEQFRDNRVDAAEIGAAESGNALYAIEVNPNGEGPLATVRVRYKVPSTEEYPEHEWTVPYTGGALQLEQASPAMRLAGTASAFSEWLATSPFAGEVTTDRLLGLMRGVPETYGADERPKKLEWMIRQAKSLEGK